MVVPDPCLFCVFRRFFRGRSKALSCSAPQDHMLLVLSVYCLCPVFGETPCHHVCCSLLPSMFHLRAEIKWGAH